MSYAEDLKKRVLELYKPPFHYDRGYVIDSSGEIVMDQDDTATQVAPCLVRWGQLGKMPDAEAMQDAAGELIAEALTTYWANANHAQAAKNIVKEICEMPDEEIEEELARHVAQPALKPQTPPIEHEIEMRYTNYRGETRMRRVYPNTIWFGATEFHPEMQWFLCATDAETGEIRDFALRDCDFVSAKAPPAPSSGEEQC